MSIDSSFSAHVMICWIRESSSEFSRVSGVSWRSTRREEEKKRRREEEKKRKGKEKKKNEN